MQQLPDATYGRFRVQHGDVQMDDEQDIPDVSTVQPERLPAQHVGRYVVQISVVFGKSGISVLSTASSSES